MAAAAAVSAAAFVACAQPPAITQTAQPFAAPRIDRLFIFVRDWTNDYDVELVLTRRDGESTFVLFRPATLEGRPRMMLDSVGPDPEDAEEIRVLLESFDVWSMNAPDAPGAACRTVNGWRSCAITRQDYSVVMRVESGRKLRVQRYTGLENSTAHPARALGDFVLAWAHKHEERKRRP